MKLTPYKFSGQLIAQELDDDGNIVGEVPVAQVVLFAHQFADLEQKVSEAWPQIEAAHAAADEPEPGPQPNRAARRAATRGRPKAAAKT